MEGKAKSLTQLNTGGKVALAYWGRRWTKGKRIVKLGPQELYDVIVNQDPLYQVSDGSENKWGRT